VKARQQKAASQHSPYDLIQQNTSRYEKAMTLVPASKTDENTTVTTNVNISRNQSNVPRESRFFPRADAAQASEKSDSPPPPEVSSLDKTQKNPVVNLPKPQAVFKLPPAKASPQKTSIVPVAQHAPRGSSQTLVEPENLWQNRFDTLFGRDSKDTTEPVTVNSSSRAPLSQSKLPSAATVSLPLIKTEANTGPSSDVLELQSKPTDEDLFPQPEFGSRPVISLPKALHLNAHLPPAHYNQSRAGLRGQPKQVDVVSKPELKFQPEKSNTITAHLPGREAKTIPLVQSRTNSNGSRGYRSSINNWNSKKSNGQGGNRSYSGSFNQNASATNHSRGGRTNSGAFGHNVDHSSGEFEPLQDGYGRGSSGNGQQGTSPRNYGRGSQRNNGSRGGTYWPKRNVSTTPSATISN
jgi:hypothetical protein